MLPVSLDLTRLRIVLVGAGTSGLRRLALLAEAVDDSNCDQGEGKLPLRPAMNDENELSFWVLLGFSWVKVLYFWQRWSRAVRGPVVASPRIPLRGTLSASTKVRIRLLLETG